MSCPDCPRGGECHEETNHILSSLKAILKDVTYGHLMCAIEGLDALILYVQKKHNEKNGRTL